MYLIRLDDASEYWNKENWHRMHDLLEKFNIKPIVAIIPKNEDPKLLQYTIDKDYIITITNWIANGWTPALHGYNHVMDSACGGINPVNIKSEFAGKSLEEQKLKIKDGVRILENLGIKTDIFVAPSHTFDQNTLQALREESSIRVISDTVASNVYYEKGFFYIPLQSNFARKIKFPIVTFCYHPNSMKEKNFIDLEAFILKNHRSFISFQDIQLQKRHQSFFDLIIRFAYFAKRKILKQAEHL